LSAQGENLNKSFKAKKAKNITDPSGITKPFFNSLKLHNSTRRSAPRLAQNKGFGNSRLLLKIEKKIQGRKAVNKWLRKIF
jgi:hypothetical protein